MFVSARYFLIANNNSTNNNQIEVTKRNAIEKSIMSNMYGYSDYDGPKIVTTATTITETCQDTDSSLTVPMTQGHPVDHDNIDDDDDDTTNPLQVGFWMEGDSMAPPCGTSITTIHKILQYLQLDANDILYDLGCGDGRICIEAWYHYHCTTIGIEVEDDLVARAQTLITKLSLSSSSSNEQHQSLLSVQKLPQVHCMDLRQIFREWTKMSPINHDSDIINNTQSQLFPLPTIIFLYLLPEALLEIESSLLQLLSIAPKNCRIVCNTWGIPSWKPIQATSIPETTAAGVSTNIYVYTTQSIPKVP